MDIETQLSINQVTSQSEAADAETKFSTNNINGQRCITPCCVDNPMGHLETNRQLDHTEITRNDLICVSDVSVFLILISSDTVIDGLSNNSQFSPDRIVVSHSKKKLIVLDVNGLFADIVSYTRHGWEQNSDFWSKGEKGVNVMVKYHVSSFHRFHILI